jgi:hypothetical protein
MTHAARMRIIRRIAQTAAAPVAPTASVSGSPTPIDITTFFPMVIKTWGPDNLAKIQQMVNILNSAIYILSAGQMDFNTLRSQAFNVDASKYPDQTLSAIVKLSGVIYHQMLANQAPSLLPPQRGQIINLIKGALNVSAIPDGSINQALQTKVGNLKEKLNSILITIK